MNALIEFCAEHMANESFPPDRVREYMKGLLPTLDYWKKYSELGGEEKFDLFKDKIIGEINSLNVEGMPRVERLDTVKGGEVNF